MPSRAVARAFRARRRHRAAGESFGELGGSEYLKTVHRMVRGSRRRST